MPSNPLFLSVWIGFFLLGLFFLWLYIRFNRVKMEWDITEGVIGDERRWSTKGNGAAPLVIYKVVDVEYKVFSNSAQSSPLRKGKKVTLYYNPNNPEEILVNTFIQSGGLYLVVSIAFFILFFLLLMII